MLWIKPFKKVTYTLFDTQKGKSNFLKWKLTSYLFGITLTKDWRAKLWIMN